MTKYKIGDTVKMIGDSSEQIRKVLSINITSEGVFYTLTSREVDLEKKDIVNGSIYLKENEIELVEEKEEK